MELKEIIFFIAILTVSNAEYVSYENYKVYKVVPESTSQVKILIDLQKQNEYVFWNEYFSVKSDVRIMVAPEKQNNFETYLEDVGISAKVVFDNIQEQINNQLRRPATRNSNNYEWDYYMNLSEINDWIDNIVSQYPDVVTFLNIGSSNEGRFIRGVKIDFKKQANPVIGMIEGGIHAREWISPACVTYIINEFLTSTDPNIRLVAENIVWHIFPVINPDGYVYSFTDIRMWRKNRNVSNHGNCSHLGEANELSNGIDLNRNFGWRWMVSGASDDPCTENYAGTSQFSEPESRAIRDYVLKIKEEGRLIYYFAIHNSYQWIMLPFSHTGGPTVLETPNYADMYEIAVRGVDKLTAVYGTVYHVGTIVDLIVPEAAFGGSSFDWVYGVANVPIVYLIELRDTEEYSFLLPPEQIIPNNIEIMAGLIEMEKTARDLSYYEFSSGQKIIYSLGLLILALFVAM